MQIRPSPAARLSRRFSAGAFLMALAVAAVAPALRATSVVPPSFPELVNDADAIYRGTVTSVAARRVERPDGAGSMIKTFVTVTIDRALKGPARSEVTLEFLGGTVGDESLVVQGMPKFSVGDREFVFVQKNGVQFCPLVAMMHGRYRMLRDAASAKEFVARDNRTPLTDTAEIGLPMTALPASVRAATASSAVERALTPAAFEARITAELDRLEQKERPN